jgi:hypothetical protein
MTMTVMEKANRMEVYSIDKANIEVITKARDLWRQNGEKATICC